MIGTIFVVVSICIFVWAVVQYVKIEKERKNVEKEDDTL